MNAHANSLSSQSWKEVYDAAIHESDVNKLPERITDAENALVLARELLYTSDDTFGEEESLDEAICILHALRSSLKQRPCAVQLPSLACKKAHDRSDETNLTAA